MTDNIILSADGKNFVEVEPDFDMETGIDRTLEKIKEKNKNRPENRQYKRYYDLTSPEGEDVTIEEAGYAKALEKGYKLPVQFEAEGEVNPVTPFQFEKNTGPGSPEFLKSAGVQTVRSAAPGVAEAVTFAGKQAKSALTTGTVLPGKETWEESKQDVQEVVNASPSGKRVGDITGGVLGSAGVIGALGKAGRGARVLGETTYEAAAGTGEGLIEGEDLPEALGRGAVRASLANAGEVASVVPKAAVATVGTSAGYIANAMGKWGIIDPVKREAIDLLTKPKGAAVRAEIANRGGQLDTIYSEFEELQKKGLVQDFDDYYSTITDSQKVLGEARNELIQRIPQETIDTEDLIQLSDDLIKDFSSYLPKDAGNSDIRRAISEYQDNVSPSVKLKNGQTVYGPFTQKKTKTGKSYLIDRKGVKFTANRIIPGSEFIPTLQHVYEQTQNLRSNISGTVSNYYKDSLIKPAKFRVVQSDRQIEEAQDRLLDLLEPELQDSFKQVNMSFADNYSRKAAVEDYSRKKTGGVAEGSKEYQPQEANPLPEEYTAAPSGRYLANEKSASIDRLRSTASDPEKINTLNTQIPDYLEQKLSQLPLLEKSTIQDALASGELTNAPEDLVRLAQGARARELRNSGERGMTGTLASTMPLKPGAVLSRRIAEGGLGEAIARTGDKGRESISNQFSFQPEPDTSLKSRLLEAGVSGTARGGLGSFESDLNPLPKLSQPRVRLKFNQENIPETLKSVIRTSSAPVEADTLLSLSSQHGIPVEELTRLFETYANGVEQEE